MLGLFCAVILTAAVAFALAISYPLSRIESRSRIPSGADDEDGLRFATEGARERHAQLSTLTTPRLTRHALSYMDEQADRS